MRFANQYLNPAFIFTIIIFVASGYLASALFPTTILVWAILLLISAGVSILIVLKFSNVNSSSVSNRSLFHHLIGLLPYLVIIPSMWFLFTSTELQISYHGDLHAGYVNQILHGTGQPTNSFVPGIPAPYYWLFHALVATVSYILNIPHPLASALISCIAVFSLLGWIHRVLLEILPRELPPVIMSMLVLFVAFGLNLLGSIQSMVFMWENFNIWHIWQLIAPVSLADPRLNFIYEKFMTYTSFSLVLLYSWVAIYGVIRFLKKQASYFDISLFLAGIAGGTAFMLIGGGIIISIITCGMLATWITLLYTKQISINLKNINFRNYISFLPAIFILVNLVLLIYALNAILALSDASQSGHHVFLLDIQAIDNFLMLFGGYYAVVIFIVIGIIATWYERNRVSIFLCWSIFAGISATLILESSETYKFVPITGMFVYLLIAYALPKINISFEDSGKSVALINPIIIILYAFVALNFISFSWGTLVEDEEKFEHRNYVYEGKSIQRQGFEYQDIFTYLQDEVAYSTILIMPPDIATYAPILSTHIPYVTNHYYARAAANVPEFDLRLGLIYRLYADPVDSNAWLVAWDSLQEKLGDQPRVYVFPHDVPATRDDLEDLGLEAIFTGDVASIYVDS